MRTLHVTDELLDNKDIETLARFMFGQGKVLITDCTIQGWTKLSRLDPILQIVTIENSVFLRPDDKVLISD